MGLLAEIWLILFNGQDFLDELPSWKPYSKEIRGDCGKTLAKLQQFCPCGIV